MLRIKFERQRRNWTQEELGRRARVRQQDISAIECGRLVPSRGIRNRLADALDVQPDALLQELDREAQRSRVAESARRPMLTLQVLRQSRGLTLLQLAAQCDVPASILSRIERGTHEPTERELKAVAWALDVPPDVLLDVVGPAATGAETTK